MVTASKTIKLLYVGSLSTHSNSYRRFKSLGEICGVVDAIDTDPFVMMRFFSSIQHHLNIGPGLAALNKIIRKKLANTSYDILLVDNKSYLSEGIFQFAKKVQPSIRIANLLTDDPFGRYTKSWRLFKKTAKFYDIIFVQREVNIGELKAVGAKNVALCYRSFDPEYNRPLELNDSDRKRFHTEVGFAGTYEDARASYIAYLIQHGINVSVTGNDFVNAKYWDIIKPHYKGPSIYGEDYIKTINGMEIALHFLRHGNRDEQDSRTFEIPACKVFMIAEESDLHKKLFNENEEAVFFNSKEELLEKVNYYRTQKLERERIAKNGYDRSFSSDYTHIGRLKEVLEKIMIENC